MRVHACLLAVPDLLIRAPVFCTRRTGFVPGHLAEIHSRRDSATFSSTRNVQPADAAVSETARRSRPASNARRYSTWSYAS
jgi:hypothetical protein